MQSSLSKYSFTHGRVMSIERQIEENMEVLVDGQVMKKKIKSTSYYIMIDNYFSLNLVCQTFTTIGIRTDNSSHGNKR